MEYAAFFPYNKNKEILNSQKIVVVLACFVITKMFISKVVFND